MFKLSTKEQFDMLYEELKKQGNISFLSTSFCAFFSLFSGVMYLPVASISHSEDETASINVASFDSGSCEINNVLKMAYRNTPHRR